MLLRLFIQKRNQFNGSGNVRYEYGNINPPEVTAGIVHAYLKNVFKEPQGVTVHPKKIWIDYEPELTADEKSRLDELMSMEITYRYYDYNYVLDFNLALKPKIQEKISPNIKRFIVHNSGFRIYTDSELSKVEERRLEDLVDALKTCMEGL